MTTIAALFCLSLTVASLLAWRRARHEVATLQRHLDEKQRERAAIDAIKDELIGNVSHELRTPLTSIRGALGLLSAGLAGSLDPRGEHLLRIAFTNTDRLIRLVTDILDLERMESGQAGLHLRRCSLTQLVEQAIEGLAPTAEAAQVTLTFTPRLTTTDEPELAPAGPHVRPGLPTLTHLPSIPLPQPVARDRRTRDNLDPTAPQPAFFDADPDRILQVLTNLLSNAIKFSPPCSAVTVHLAAAPAMLHLRVTDQGRGIPENKLEAIFDRFQQVEATDARQKGGTGLGLAICRTIVHQHGGAIRAERNPGPGVTFHVDLPRIQRFTDQNRQDRTQDPSCTVSSSSTTKTTFAR